jgi:hypothetical protein
MYVNMCKIFACRILGVVEPLFPVPQNDRIRIGIPFFSEFPMPTTELRKEVRGSVIGNFPLCRNVGVRCNTREDGGSHYW